MVSDSSVAAPAQDTSRASPGREGPPRTFLGATAVVVAAACIVALLLVASGVSFWAAVGIPVIILAALLLGLMHVFAKIGRSLAGLVVVGLGYVAAGVATLGVAASNGTELIPGPGLVAGVAFLGGVLTLLGATRKFLRDHRPPSA